MNDTPADPFGEDVPDDYREPIDPAVIARAVEQLRAVAKGNGIISGQITENGVDGETLNFEGLAFFKIEAKIAEKRVAGKQKGEVVASAGDMHQKMEVEQEKAAHNPDVRRHTIAALKKRRDIGFMVKNQYVALDSLRKNFVVHEGCSSCASKGKIKCGNCSGQGRTKCKKCFGSKQMPCTLCRGTKMMGTPNGRAPCTRCQGRGRMPCNLCQRSGGRRCEVCQGKMHTNCKNCNGAGWMSLVGTINIKARSQYDFDRSALTPEIAAAIDAQGPRLVIDKHIDAAIIEDEERAKALDSMAAEGEYIIPYHLRLPTGRITFALPKKQEITAKLFGMQPTLTELPPFLEAPLAPALAALNEAAAGKTERVRDAMKMRFVSEAILTALRHGPAKGVRILTKRYPLGLEATTIASSVAAAEKVVAALITRPRIIGLAAGSVVSAALYGAYYIGPGFAALAGKFEPHVGMALDVGILLCGGAATALTAQQLATNGVRRALGKVAAKIPSSQLAPASAFSYGISAAITALLFVGIIEIAVEMKKPAPAWYTQIRESVLGPSPLYNQDAVPVDAAAHEATQNETAAPGPE